MLKDMNVSEILRKNSFATKKKFGQNFITDVNLLAAIVDDAEIESSDIVVEIGAGAGTLTAALAQRAKKVIAFEIDKTLKPVLHETLDGYENIEIVFSDILKVAPSELKKLAGGSFKVVANLPYYITSPVIFYFLESEFPLISLTVMVQREVALRMTARPDTSDYGVLTLAVESRADAKITRSVSRKMFFPEPNVDSAVVRLTLNDGIPNRKTFDKLVRAAFSCRRKTLVNNLMQSFGMPRAKAEDLLVSIGVDVKVRGEALDKEQFLALANKMDEETI